MSCGCDTVSFTLWSLVDEQSCSSHPAGQPRCLKKHVWLNNNNDDDDNSKEKKGRSDGALWFVLCEAVRPPRCCFAATSLLHFVMWKPGLLLHPPVLF